jgi:hypothetical protein
MFVVNFKVNNIMHVIKSVPPWYNWKNTTSQMKCSYKDCGEAIEPESNRADVRGFNVPKSDRKGIILYHIHRILFCLKLSIFAYFKWVIIYLKHLYTKTWNNCEFSLKAKRILDKLVKVREFFFPNILKNT